LEEEMREKNTIIICAIVCATLIICGILFWPTLYRYDKTQSKLVRVNRITGYTEVLSGSLWESVAKGEIFKAKDYGLQPSPLPAGEKAKIMAEKIMGALYVITRSPLPKGSYVSVPDKNDFSFRGVLYNGSEWTINKLMVVIDAKNNDDTSRWKRKYNVNIIGGSINAFSSGTITVEPSDAYAVAHYIWFIDEAYGYKSK